jgi:hypothetical protein
LFYIKSLLANAASHQIAVILKSNKTSSNILVSCIDLMVATFVKQVMHALKGLLFVCLAITMGSYEGLAE